MLLGAVPSGTVVMLRRGSSGAAVTNLQQKLAAAGFSPGAIDGKFGPATESAVRMFQTARGLAVDGIVGPKTAAALGLSLPAGVPQTDGSIVPSTAAAAAGDAGAAGEGPPWGLILGGVGAVGVLALLMKGRGGRRTASNPRRRRRRRR